MNYRNKDDYSTLCKSGTCGGTRTPNLWFWRPLLCQLSYTRKPYKPDFSAFSAIRLNLGAQYYTPASSPLSSIPRPVGRGGGGACGLPPRLITWSRDGAGARGSAGRTCLAQVFPGRCACSWSLCSCAPCTRCRPGRLLRGPV